MPSIFLIHGIYGSPEENWFPWMKEQLTAKGCDVYVPPFRTREPKTLLYNWLEEFEAYREHIQEDSIIIGHSMGVPFALKILESTPVQSAYLVSGFMTNPINKFSEVMADFTDRQFDFPAITRNCKKFEIIHSDNDPYVPIEKTEELSKTLEAPITLIKNAGHFNTDAGFTEFPQLLEMIEQELPEQDPQ